MKLRISGRSLRVRLLHQEVQRLAREGHLQEELLLPPGRALRYRLALAQEVSALTASFSGELLEIRLPRTEALAWCHGEEVALEGTVRQGESEVRIAIEKDFDSFPG